MGQPSYYAVIPADVRYHPKLSANAKLLYGEITALCNSQGYCWANNKYFAKLYEVDERTIRRWIEALEKYEFIVRTSTVKDEDGTMLRKIYLKAAAPDPSADKNVRGGGQKCPGGPDNNVRHNNTNNITSNIYNACARVTQTKKKSKPKFDDFSQRNYDFDQLEAKLLNRSLDVEGDTG